METHCLSFSFELFSFSFHLFLYIAIDILVRYVMMKEMMKAVKEYMQLIVELLCKTARFF